MTENGGISSSYRAFKADSWDIALVMGIDGIWLDIYRINPKTRNLKTGTRTKKR